MGNFNDLIVWQKSKELAVAIYKLAELKKKLWDFGFRDQILRSVVSIPSNIAEGEQLESDKQAIRHFYIARGSTAELMTLLVIGKEIGFLESEESDSLITNCRFISMCLTNLIKARYR